MTEHGFMVRELDSHKTNECNRTIEILADALDPISGASHVYEVAVPGGQRLDLEFSRVGQVGVTHEALLAILIDRLECFQAGKFANDYNATALDHLRAARAALLARTAEREARGVEGRHEL